MITYDQYKLAYPEAWDFDLEQLSPEEISENQSLINEAKFNASFIFEEMPVFERFEAHNLSYGAKRYLKSFICFLDLYFN